jgi:hypothetical protein
VPLTAASTHDIEWNGEPLPSRGTDGCGDQAVGAFVAGVAQSGTTRLIENVDVEMTTVEVDGHLLPLSTPRADAEARRAWRAPSFRHRASDVPPSYVVSPTTHYVRYAREELGELSSPVARRMAGAILSGLEVVLRAGRVDDVVIVGNALLSTNLLPDPGEQQVVDLTERLVAEHPGRAIAWRSVHARGSRLPDTLRRAGYRLIPSRSILFTATRDTEWNTLRDTRRDRALLESSPYRVRRLTAAEDAASYARIAELYRLLYLDKYSFSNPQYTAEFIELAHATGLLEFTVLERDDRIDAVFGARTAHGFLAAPVVGYDTALPRDAGLYRMLSYQIAQSAHDHGVDLHNSSGVANFKRNRGAEPEFEYTAVFTRHLPPVRRAAWAVLDAVVTRVAVPMVTRNGL